MSFDELVSPRLTPRFSFGQIETRSADADLDKFNWDLTDKDQEKLGFKKMVFLWFHDDVIRGSANVCN